jgi:hypothetical protein
VTARSSPSSTSCTPSWAPGQAATPPWTPATCSSRCSPAVSCARRCDDARRVPPAHREGPALERRFQQVFVGEPSVEDTIAILRGLKERYEAHHKVEIEDSALVAAAALSDRYITGASCPTRPSTSSTRPPRGCGWRSTPARSRSTSCSAPSTGCKMEELHLAKETDDASVERLARLRADLADKSEELAGSTPAGRPRSPG